MSNAALVYPALGLIGWTFVMWVWMYATRIPAMQALEIDVEELSRTGAPLVLPTEVARVADNYNHLHEQPVLFYALVLSAFSLGAVDAGQVGLAWAYVIARVVHSLIQATLNLIMLRFGVFALGSLILFVLFVGILFLI